MAGKNHGICHSCRCKGHFFVDCPKKRLCPWCKRAFVKCFEVEKETKNKGKFFNCCGGKCSFWEWVGEGDSSIDSVTSTNAATNESVVDVTGMFESRLRLNDEQEIKFSVNVTIHKNKASVEVDNEGKALIIPLPDIIFVQLKVDADSESFLIYFTVKSGFYESTGLSIVRGNFKFGRK